MVEPYRRHLRAVIYCRISLAQYGDTVKVKRQEKLCRKLAERLGWEVMFVYVDNNASAWKRNRKRPGWDAMLAAVEAGEVDAIITYHGDRLIRQPWDLEVLLNLADGRGLKLASPTTNRDLDDADDRYRLRQDVAKACNESDSISRRTRDAHADRAAKGVMKKGGYRPFGYKRSGKIHDSEAAQYRDAVARLIAGESKTSVLRDWNRHDLLTTAGNAWEYKAFSKMLASPRYAGLSVYKGEIVGTGKWKPLVTRETWDALQAVLQVATALYAASVPTGAAKYLLSGIAVHPGCGSTLRIYHDVDPARLSYLCSDRECGEKVRRNVANLDEYVIGNVLAYLADDSRIWGRLASVRADDGAASELAALRARRAATVETFARSDTMSPVALEGMLRKMDALIAAAEAKVSARASVHVLDGLCGISRREWDDLPMTRRRAIVRATVTVKVFRSRRGRVFDTSSALVEEIEV